MPKFNMPFVIRFFLCQFAFICTVLPIFSQNNNSFINYYPSESKGALAFYTKNKSLLINSAQKCNASPEFLFAIVSPEIAWYSAFRDFFETSVTEAFYVEMGSSYGNFSVGWFQMKPKFVEQIERMFVNDKNWLFLSKFNSSDETLVRRERLTRVKTLEWQMIYLCAFYIVMEKKFGSEFIDTKEKLCFYSTVYNTGLNAKKEDVFVCQGLKGFPGKFGNRKFNYSKIALEFYEKLLH
jgi:hypothetical protein